MKSGDHIFVHAASATPLALLDALARRTELENVTLYHLHTAPHRLFSDPALMQRFHNVSVFSGGPTRGAINDGLADLELTARSPQEAELAREQATARVESERLKHLLSDARTALAQGKSAQGTLARLLRTGRPAK